MATNPLDSARKALLSSTATLLERLDENDVGGSLRAISPELVTVRQAARSKTLETLIQSTRKQLAQNIGVDLHWDLFDQSQWVGAGAATRYSLRLQRVANWLDNQQGLGRDPKELKLWTNYWQMQVAGSDVHDMARRVRLDIARNTPVVGRVMRIAEPGACSWCRMMATRGAVYVNNSTALSAGHGHCRCEIVTVSDAKSITLTQEAGAAVWNDSGIGRPNPFRSTTSPNGRLDPSLTAIDTQTIERRVAVLAQLASYRPVVSEGHATEWMLHKISELEAELASLPAY